MKKAKTLDKSDRNKNNLISISVIVIVMLINGKACSKCFQTEEQVKLE